MNPVMSVEMFREDVAAEILRQVDSVPSLSKSERNRISRAMGGRGFVNRRRRDRILDEAVKQIHSEQLIGVTAEGIEPAIDWDGIASFLERIMPLILTLVKLFGG